MKFYIIQTERLLLRGLSPEDITFIFNNLSKPEIKEILGHRSEEEYTKEEYKHKNGYSSYNRQFVLFLLIDKASGKIIGRCGIHNWIKDHGRAELGYVMEENEFKRKGMMSEAVQAIIDYGFRELKLNRLEALVGIGNTPSLKIMDNFNFKSEGLLRKHTLVDSEFQDARIFSILSEEYFHHQISG